MLQIIMSHRISLSCSASLAFHEEGAIFVDFLDIICCKPECLILFIRFRAVSYSLSLLLV